ncbi:hypothetical protein PISMIDRAFT_19810 [Pisolithus microcarpus 441]|uniref:Uncharacterized protein n=1 Tax=Pisolithus microcarpus 441 TaxID=765257 RepID=A0A0C9Y1N2_9AGAM|nr:hypothetical protein PISMIDRAFT_19810 [Pisolithus microcarpus 441]
MTIALVPTQWAKPSMTRKAMGWIFSQPVQRVTGRSWLLPDTSLYQRLSSDFFMPEPTTGGF